jgi:hypothetical protein
MTPPDLIAAGPPARASGKLVPVASNTVVGSPIASATETAVAYLSEPARRLTATPRPVMVVSTAVLTAVVPPKMYTVPPLGSTRMISACTDDGNDADEVNNNGPPTFGRQRAPGQRIGIGVRARQHDEYAYAGGLFRQPRRPFRSSRLRRVVVGTCVIPEVLPDLTSVFTPDTVGGGFCVGVSVGALVPGIDIPLWPSSKAPSSATKYAKSPVRQIAR